MIEWYTKALAHGEGEIRDVYFKNATTIVKRLLSSPSLTRDIDTYAEVLATAGEISEGYELLKACREEDLGDPIAYYRSAWECHGAWMNTRLDASHRASRILIGKKQSDEAWNLSRQAVDLIPFMCPSHMGANDKKESIVFVHNFGIYACVAGLELGKTCEALES